LFLVSCLLSLLSLSLSLPLSPSVSFLPWAQRQPATNQQPTSSQPASQPTNQPANQLAKLRPQRRAIRRATATATGDNALWFQRIAFSLKPHLLPPPSRSPNQACQPSGTVRAEKFPSTRTSLPITCLIRYLIHSASRLVTVHWRFMSQAPMRGTGRYDPPKVVSPSADLIPPPSCWHAPAAV
jgi:hypothetical protein